MGRKLISFRIEQSEVALTVLTLKFSLFEVCFANVAPERFTVFPFLWGMMVRITLTGKCRYRNRPEGLLLLTWMDNPCKEMYLNFGC